MRHVFMGTRWQSLQDTDWAVVGCLLNLNRHAGITVPRFFRFGSTLPAHPDAS